MIPFHSRFTTFRQRLSLEIVPSYILKYSRKNSLSSLKKEIIPTKFITALI